MTLNIEISYEQIFLSKNANESKAQVHFSDLFFVILEQYPNS